jgi:starch phosphorylase
MSAKTRTSTDARSELDRARDVHVAHPDVRTGMTADALQQAVVDHLRYSVGRLPAVATRHDYYRSLALAVRDRMLDRWTRTTESYFEQGHKLACYLSAEFLMGPHLANNLLNLGLEQAAGTAMAGLGQNLNAILECEEEPELSAEDETFRQHWRTIKRANKQALAAYIHAHTGTELDPDWLFDILVKRIHEYKRQHLNVLHIVTLYRRLKENPGLAIPARAFIFGGKAAPGYRLAKLIIKLINAVAETVNADPDVNSRMRVAFVPNLNVQNAQHVYPAADLSEQISTAGMEASGTGNMKFMMNGAVTIGTLDGANIEIRDAVGADNFYLFGLTSEEVARVKGQGYRPADYVARNAELRAALELIASGHFSRGDAAVFAPLIDNLLGVDPFLVLADYAAYIAYQEQVGSAWQDTARWTRMSILNTARSGMFSSDRAIREYCDEIWRVPGAPVADTSRERQVIRATR